MPASQYITKKILALRQDIAKLITEKMTVKEAWMKLSHHDIGYNSFYQQCKMLIDLGYLQNLGFKKESRTHCLLIKSINHEYQFEQHYILSGNQKAPSREKEEPVDAPVGVAKTYTSNDRHWFIEKKKTGRQYPSGASLSAVMFSANY